MVSGPVFAFPSSVSHYARHPWNAPSCGETSQNSPCFLCLFGHQPRSHFASVFWAHNPTFTKGRTYRAMLLNVNTRLGNPELVKATIQHYNPDIVVLEEISSQWVSDLRWLTKSHPHSRIQPQDDNFGIGLFSKFPLAESKIVYIGDAEVPSIIARVDSGNGTLFVIATHPLPPGGASYSRWRNNQLHAIPDYIPPDILLVILLGDLNVTPWNYHFRNLLKRSGLRDSSKGHGLQPTWPSNFPLMLIPIDHCLHTRDIFVIKREVGPNAGSDHYPLIVDFVVENEKHKHGATR